MKPEPTRHRFEDERHLFDYTVQRKPRMKHRYIRIRGGEVFVTAPLHTSHAVLHAFVAKQADWIARHLARAAQEMPYDLARPGTALYWRGRPCTVTMQPGKSDRLDCDGNSARFTLRASPEHHTMRTLVDRHFKAQAPHILLPRVAYWEARMDLHPVRVGFRRARTRWGSCSARNTLSLNTHLLILPDPLVDYVIVHELAHIQEKNHAKTFWDLVAGYLPDWPARRAGLRTYEKFLR